jgi:hypothetical protein
MFLDIPLSVTLSDVRPNIAFASAPLKYPDNPIVFVQSTLVQYLATALVGLLLVLEHEKTKKTKSPANINLFEK